jgi:hypothetical protein
MIGTICVQQLHEENLQLGYLRRSARVHAYERDSAGIPQEIRQSSFTTNVRQPGFTLRIGNFSSLQPRPTTPGEFELYYDV